MIDDIADDWIICWLYTDICRVWIICRISLYLRCSGWCMLPTWGGLRGNLLITCWGRSHVGNEYQTIVYPPYSIVYWPQISSIVTCFWFIIWRVFSLRRLIGKYNECYKASVLDWWWCRLALCSAGIVLCLDGANERRRYIKRRLSLSGAHVCT